MVKSGEPERSVAASLLQVKIVHNEVNAQIITNPRIRYPDIIFGNCHMHCQANLKYLHLIIIS